ncbi:MAG: ABC transporter ATP-binding protein [Parachlamydiaceae bacterium]|nr:ABC transporter ATP-binding protein [Parachlamydiaceae bacterium]
MAPVIEIENVSKKYLISHQNQDSYDTLVNTLSRWAKRVYNLVRHPFISSLEGQKEEFWALQNISFNIQEGDRIGIIGRNGAGKSTLLKILSRITLPTTGEIRLRGRVASLLEVGTGFHLELTGRENIFLNGAILGMSREEIKRKFDDIVAFAEVEQFLDTPLKRFSSGMHMRLGFAIAAHLDSDILIVDEVLAVGDAQFQQKCLKKLGDLSSAGRTVLFVSHDIGSVLTLCNKGVFLEKGALKYIGPIDQCVNAYMQTCHAHPLKWVGKAGDEHIHFMCASISSDATREFFYQGDRVQVEVDYQVLQPSKDLVLGVAIWNQRNQLLGRSQTWDHPQEFPLLAQKGKQRAVFNFDASLFHEGEYTVRLECFIHNKKSILKEEISLKFPVYAKQRNTHSTRAIRSGVSLGTDWSISSKEDI